ncbi:Nucleoid-associated protein YgaU, contains BON and LysM domains [Pannonibacter indicus]|uniref:Nucleoid-associated protein YgaU, contains BON and LysM domains n=2 Tax=Pannonibacter indicus TaxID=466044 RepID=A0A0K6HZI6_9HYPH|nr:Nucleoid-associated protein YgaU, contains BON and LysM domains [Pannonibacter indicus]
MWQGASCAAVEESRRTSNQGLGSEMTRKGVTVSLVIAVVVGIIALLTGYLSQKDAGAPQEMASAPQAASQTAAPATQAEAPAAAALDTASRPAAVQSPAPAAEPAATPEPEAPSFDVAGIEADGAAVIAGRAAPGSTVSLLANGEVIGTATANEAGEWSMVLDKPLAPGDYDMLLRMETADGKIIESAQRLTVSLPGSGRERPLIVLNTPDAPSSVLQRPAAVEVASAQATPKPEETAPAAEAASEAAPAAAPEGELAAEAAPAEPAPAAAETAAPEPGTTELAVASAPEPSSAPEAAPQATAEAAPDAASDATPDTAPEAAAEAAPEQADVPAPAPEPAPVAAAPAPAEAPAAEVKPVIAPVTVEAVESEDGKLYVAGTSTADALLRIYVADALVGETKANGDGRWLLETTAEIPVGDVEVRADHVDPVTGAVLARAAVSFRKAELQEIILSKVEEAGSQGASDAAAAPQVPNVIIRKGDNLWNISRRLYGTGFRYTTIYQANKDQIRNPDLIYPGQVFLTPGAAPDATQGDAVSK